MSPDWRSGGLLSERQIEADRGQTAESTHQLFTFTSVVADRSAQGKGVSCSMRQGGCSAPRRQPSARSVRSPLKGLGFRSVGPPPTVCRGDLAQPVAGVDAQALGLEQTQRDPDRPIDRRPARAPKPRRRQRLDHVDEGQPDDQLRARDSTASLAPSTTTVGSMTSHRRSGHGLALQMIKASPDQGRLGLAQPEAAESTIN